MNQTYVNGSDPGLSHQDYISLTGMAKEFVRRRNELFNDKDISRMITESNLQPYQRETAVHYLENIRALLQGSFSTKYGLTKELEKLMDSQLGVVLGERWGTPKRWFEEIWREGPIARDRLRHGRSI